MRYSINKTKSFAFIFSTKWILINIMLFANVALSQNITISGYIGDNETGEKLLGATVIDLISQKGTISNSFGFYSLTLPIADTIILSSSYLGFNNNIYQLIHVKENKELNFNLKPNNLIDEVVISATKEGKIQERTEMSIVKIPIKQINLLPAIAGEADIIKAIQLMPGVQSGAEGQSGLYVRGGSPDQNLILLDDVPLYSINHLGGFVSVFNPDALNDVTLIKGGFPARYGSRLSSVLDIRMKDGNMKKYHAQGMIGIISSKLSIEGPIKVDTTSFIISARRFMLDLFTRPISKISSDQAFGYTFYDINAKINHKFSDKDRLYFSFYNGDDKIISKREDDGGDMINKLIWGNLLGSLRWNHLFSQKLFSNASLNYTRYRYLSSFKYEDNDTKNYSESNYNSSIKDYTGKIDFEYYAKPNIKFKFGLSSIFHSSSPGVTILKQEGFGEANVDTSFNNIVYEALEHSVYVESLIDIGKKLKTNIGLRASNYTINKNSYNSFEPRILLNYMINSNSSIKASFASMKQYVHLLSFSGIGLPSELWVPATEKVPPETSYQFALGFAKSVYQDLFELSIEGYYKRLDNLISYSEGITYRSASLTWEDKVESGGIGIAYGLEVLLQKKAGDFTGWIGYTLSRSERQFENINNGKSYPYKYDRTHDLSIVLNYRINENINISATWVYGTGNALTLPVGYRRSVGSNYDGDIESYFNEDREEYEPSYNNWVDIYTSKNGSRMKAFHKLDFGINFTKQKRWGERTWNVSIYNLYNRQNPYYYFFNEEKNIDGIWENKLYQQSLFPLIPSLSYSFKF